MKRIVYRAFLLPACCFLLFGHAFGQAALKGPTCVVPVTVYEYDVTGNTDSAAVLQVCATGGVIAGSAGICTQAQAGLVKVLVTWTDTVSQSGSLVLTSSSGISSQLMISFTQLLQPGVIDSAVKIQFVDSASFPAPITCSPDSGGSCAPVYAYQWQQSADGIRWTNIAGAINDTLILTTPVVQTTYFRRQITETGSGTIGYSDVAAVFIKADAQGFYRTKHREDRSLASALPFTNIQFYSDAQPVL